MKTRTLYQEIWDELSSEKNMVLLAGPRQAGKTTFSKIIAQQYANQFYFNWDISGARVKFLENPLFFREMKRVDDTLPLVVFDELHKFKDWKNYLKGLYDEFKQEYQFLISGSGRLDTYRKGSDSLAGRYYLFHLWPFTISELGNNNHSFGRFMENPLRIRMDNHLFISDLWHNLTELSGFPEPFLSGKKTTYRRWSNTYSNQLIREDIREQADIRSIGDVESLYMLLPSKIGRPLSIPSLAKSLKVSYNSIQKWIMTFESLFLLFSITPWSKKISRAIQKERKLYLWDSPRIEDPAARFENMIALELYRAISSWNDIGFGSFSLHYIRNRENQEVDFLIANERKPFLMIEAKLTETTPSPSLRIFQNQLKIPAIQLTQTGDSYRMIPNNSQHILCAPASQWLSGLP